MNKEYEKFIAEYFIKNKIDNPQYATSNVFKRSLFFKRLYECMDIINNINLELEKDSLIVDFGCGRGLFYLMLKIEGFLNVVGIDINSRNLTQAAKFVEDFNKEFGTEHSIQFSESLKFDKIQLLCALDVFEHLTKNELETLISNIEVKNYLLCLPTENIIYNILNGLKREPTHKIRYFEVLNIIKEKSYIIKSERSILGFFNIYYLNKNETQIIIKGIDHGK